MDDLIRRPKEKGNMTTSGLNTVELLLALKGNSVTGPHFGGVYAADQVMNMKQRPEMIVVNTDPQDQPGQHWLLFYFPLHEREEIEMFDSLGKGLQDYPSSIRDGVLKFGSVVRSMKRRVQPLGSALCGHYCLHYAYQRCSGFSMEKIAEDMPSAEWIKLCIPLLFSIDSVHSNSQCCVEMY